MSAKWSEERREAMSKIMKTYWETKSFRKKQKAASVKRRKEGKNLVNVAQLESREKYREYQRLQHRDWYRRNREKWNEYTNMQKMRKKSFDELIVIRDKHLRNGRDDLAERVNKVLNEILAEEERKIKLKAEEVMRGEA